MDGTGSKESRDARNFQKYDIRDLEKKAAFKKESWRTPGKNGNLKSPDKYRGNSLEEERSGTGKLK